MYTRRDAIDPSRSGAEHLFVHAVGYYMPKKQVISKEQREYIENINWKDNIYNNIDDQYQLLELPLFADLKEFCLQSVNEYYNGLLRYETELEICLSWANRTLPNSSHHLHRHPNSVMSGVFYLDSTADCPIEFHSPALPNNPYSNIPIEWNPFNSDTRGFRAAANTCIIFPSYMWHEVAKSKDTKPRYSIAFNTFFKKGQEIGSYATALKV